MNPIDFDELSAKMFREDYCFIQSVVGRKLAVEMEAILSYGSKELDNMRRKYAREDVRSAESALKTLSRAYPALRAIECAKAGNSYSIDDVKEQVNQFKEYKWDVSEEDEKQLKKIADARYILLSFGSLARLVRLNSKNHSAELAHNIDKYVQDINGLSKNYFGKAIFKDADAQKLASI